LPFEEYSAIRKRSMNKAVAKERDVDTTKEVWKRKKGMGKGIEERNKKEGNKEQEEEGKERKEGEKKEEVEQTLASVSILKQLGYLLETHECQALLLFFITVDVLAMLLLDYLSADAKYMSLLISSSSSTSFATNQSLSLSSSYETMLGLLSSISTFCSTVILLELSLLCVCFGKRFFLHVGYLSDFLLVVIFILNKDMYMSSSSSSSSATPSFSAASLLKEQAQYYNNYNNNNNSNSNNEENLFLLSSLSSFFFFFFSLVLQSADLLCHLPKEIHLLSFLRCWRFIRLFSSLLSSVKEEHEHTKDIVVEKEQEIAEMEMELSRKNDAIEREIEGRKRLMLTLQGYKDEVDTLNEALRIAAMDVAMVAEEEEEEEEEMDMEDSDLELDSDLDMEIDDDEEEEGEERGEIDISSEEEEGREGRIEEEIERMLQETAGAKGEEEDDDGERRAILRRARKKAEKRERDNRDNRDRDRDRDRDEKHQQQRREREREEKKRRENGGGGGTFYINEDGTFNYK